MASSLIIHAHHRWCFLLLISFVLVNASLPTSPSNNNVTCSSVRSAYRARGLPDRDVPQSNLPIPAGSHQLRFCGSRSGSAAAESSQPTCCTEAMENRLNDASRQQYELVVRDASSSLSATFAARAKKFDEFFRELLENSKRDFHDMFKRTYGILYEQNSEVFTDLFRDLEDYYARGKLDLEEAMDHFFTALYQRMFTVLNAQFRFDDKYLICVNTHMKELKPFGDVPKKLSVQVKRSFVATRTFTQALNVGRDVIAKMQSLEVSGDCMRAVMRMSMCPVCQGLGEVKPCGHYCLNVFKGCLAYHADLGVEWDNYVDALMKVADRLLGPFNIELVVDPIDIKISDAIMNFQENGYEISQKVFKGCGQPRLGKRSATTSEINFESVKFDRAGSGGTGTGGANVRPTTAAGTSLDRLVRDIKQKVKSSRGYWSKLPQTVCAHEKLAPLAGSADGDCWNGSERARYSAALMADGVAAQAGNPEVTLDASRPNTLVNDQIFTLRLITNKLENAYNGMDVEWDDSVSNGSGSGSGSGDGAGSMEEDDDEDRERGKHPGNGHNTNNANRGGGVGGGGSVSGIDSNRQQPKSKPKNYDGIPRNNVGNSEDEDEDEDDDDIEFTPGGTAPKPENKIPTASSAPPADSTQQSLSPNKALTSYLVPIVVMWLGNMF
ncbi:glypican-6-like [Daphnia pulicaria]|uniref:glypican-6-like n=1 Tax=Daphnia pulicaria TaxID=35523 RepID=UPI001EEC19C8|nr:glypican-6-like [Daphnia pulicaria]